MSLGPRSWSSARLPPFIGCAVLCAAFGCSEETPVPLGGPSAGSSSASAAGSGAAGGGTMGCGVGGASGCGVGAGGSAGSGGTIAGAAALGGAGGSGGSAFNPPSGPFKLSSSDFEDGESFPAICTCADSGQGHSPELAWGPGAHAPSSYAITLTDVTVAYNHWIIWDIPTSIGSLRAALPNNEPAGSKQVSFAPDGGFAGPCPGGSLHTYELMLYALDVETLPFDNLESDRQEIITLLKEHALATSTLRGNSDAKRP